MHDHGLTVPVLFGPTVLYLILYFSVPVAAGFALMRVVLPPPERRDALLVTGAATTALLVKMLLVPAFDLPSRVVVLLLVAGIVPLAVWWRVPEFAFRMAIAAPWLVATTVGLAVVQLLRPSADFPGCFASALAAVSWLTFCAPRTRAGRVALRVMAGALSLIVVAVTGQAALNGVWQ